MTNGEYADEQMQRGGPLSRKKFLAGSAALLGGGALAAAMPSVAKAHSTPEPPTDIDILNFALTLEHLEAVFYTQGLRKFDRQDFRFFFGPNRGLPPKAGLLEVAGLKVHDYFEIIRDHEQTHVDTLISVIKDLGGEPVPEARYNFARTAFTSLKKFIAVAQLLENTGVTAYDGAVAHIEAAQLLTAGATIATVEARHASYLNLLNGDVPFPDTFDKPVAPRTICEAVQAENGGFIVSTPKPYGPYASLDALCAKLPTTTTP